MAAAADRARGVRPDRLNLGPLTEVGKVREAAENLRQSMHGAPFDSSKRRALLGDRRSGRPAQRIAFAGRA